MKNKLRFTWLLMLSCLVFACAGPGELYRSHNSWRVNTVWSQQVGKGSVGHYIQISQ